MMKIFNKAICIIILCISVLFQSCQNNTEETAFVASDASQVVLSGNWKCTAVEGSIKLATNMFGLGDIVDSFNEKLKEELLLLKINYADDSSFVMNYKDHKINGRYQVKDGKWMHSDDKGIAVFFNNVQIQQDNDNLKYHLDKNAILELIKQKSKDIPESVWDMITISSFTLTFQQS